MKQTQDAEQRERERQARIEEESRRRKARERAEARQRVRQAAKEELRSIVKAWNEAFALEAFFTELSRRAAALAGEDRANLESRIGTARELLGGRDAVPTEYSVRVLAVAVAGQRLIRFQGRMTALFAALLASLRVTIRSRVELAAEILALRHQLAVLQRATPKRPRLRPLDRLLWVLLSSVWPNWRQAVQIVTPATVVRWHRRAFSAYWRWNSRRRRIGRPALASTLRALICQMRDANPLWGAPRIHGELQKLGIDVSQASVAKYLRRRRGPRRSPGAPFSPITSPSSPRSTSSRSRPPRSGCCLCSSCCLTTDAASSM